MNCGMRATKLRGTVAKCSVDEAGSNKRGRSATAAMPINAEHHSATTERLCLSGCPARLCGIVDADWRLGHVEATSSSTRRRYLRCKHHRFTAGCRTASTRDVQDKFARAYTEPFRTLSADEPGDSAAIDVGIAVDYTNGTTAKTWHVPLGWGAGYPSRRPRLVPEPLGHQQCFRCTKPAAIRSIANHEKVQISRDARTRSAQLEEDRKRPLLTQSPRLRLRPASHLAHERLPRVDKSCTPFWRRRRGHWPITPSAFHVRPCRWGYPKMDRRALWTGDVRGSGCAGVSGRLPASNSCAAPWAGASGCRTPRFSC